MLCSLNFICSIGKRSTGKMLNPEVSVEDLKAVEVCYPIHEFGLHNFYILNLELF